mgnify:FL=1
MVFFIERQLVESNKLATCCQYRLHVADNRRLVEGYMDTHRRWNVSFCMWAKI